MKSVRKLLVLLLTALLICASIFTAVASVIPPVTETYAGKTVAIDFSYDNIAGIHGTFTTSGDDIIESIKIVPDSAFTGTQKNNVIAFFADSAQKFVANIEVVVKASAKKGDECKVVFEYETTANGKLPTTPSYKYEEAIIKIVLDYTELDKQINNAKNYEGKEDKYTTDSWNAFIKAWDAAKKARTDAKTQKEVDDAAKALKNAIAALELKPVVPALNYEELKAQMDRASEREESLYTAESWAKMKEAWDEAIALYGNANTQDEINAAAAKLKAAIDALELKPVVSELNYEELKAQMDRASEREESIYTAESWAKMKEAWDEAIALYGNANTQDEIDAAAAKLKAAIDALELKPVVSELNYEELKAEMERANLLDESLYTAESWAEMKEAWDKANALYGNANTQDEIDAAAAALKSGIDNLELKPTDEPVQPEEPEEDDKPVEDDKGEDLDSPATEGVIMLLPLFLIIAALVVLFVYSSKRKTESTSK